MPGIENGLIPTERAPVLADQAAILTQFDPIGIGADLDRTPDCARSHRVFVAVYLLLSNRTRQVLETDAGTAWNPSKRSAYRTKLGRSASKISQIVRSRNSG